MDNTSCGHVQYIEVHYFGIVYTDCRSINLTFLESRVFFLSNLGVCVCVCVLGNELWVGPLY